MLAAIGDYFLPWMFPLMGVIVFVWLFVGGLLFQKFIKPISDHKNITLKNGIWLAFISGVTGLITTGCVFLMVSKLCGSFTSIFIFGAIFSIPTFFLTVLATIYAVKKSTIKMAFNASFIPAVGMLLATSIFILPAGYFSFNSVQEKRAEKNNRIMVNRRIRILSDMVAALRFNKIPDTLEGVIEAYQKLPTKEQLYQLSQEQCKMLLINPKAPNSKVGYIFVPRKRYDFDTKRDKDDQEVTQLIVCENPRFCEKSICAAYVGYRRIEIEKFKPKEFKDILEQPTNQGFKDKIDQLGK